MTFSIPAGRDAAQQVVTALIHGDRDEAFTIAQEFDDTLVLALVLGDLCAYVHYRWSRALSFDADQRSAAWASLLADVEEWRLTKEAAT